jgi:agmatine/peptidylarginine deiminase
MPKRKTVYFSDLLEEYHLDIYGCLKTHLNIHGYEVKILKKTKDIWIRDFMPIVFDDKCVQYRYYPNYLIKPALAPYRTDPDLPIKEIGLKTEKIELILDGGNVVKYNNSVIMTDKVFQENIKITLKELSGKFFPSKKIVIVPRDPDVEEIYGHADGMVRFISENHLLVNSQYTKTFKKKLHKRLKERGFKITELNMKEDTQYSWGYINFFHIDNLIIQPSIDKVNDEYVKGQLEALYPNTTIELCDASELVKKGGVFNCVSWEL